MKAKFFDIKRANPYSFFILLLLVALMLHPWSNPNFEVPKIGDISKKEIIAPFTFYIMKSDSELAREEAELNSSIPEMVEVIDTIRPLMIDSLKNLLAATREIRNSVINLEEKRKAIKNLWGELSNDEISTLLTTRQLRAVEEKLVEILHELYLNGIAPKELLTDGISGLYSVKIDNEEHIYPLETLIDTYGAKNELKTKLTQAFPDYEELVNLSYRICERFIRPNLRWDKEKTKEKRDEIVKTIVRQKGVVLKDERIVGSHEKITPEIYEKLVSLKKAMQKTELGKSREKLYSLLPVFLFYILMVLMVLIFTRIFKQELFKNRINLSIFILLIFVELIFSKAGSIIKLSPHILPTPLAGVLGYFLFGSKIAAGLIGAIALFVGTQLSFSFLDSFLVLTTGMLSLYLFSKLKSRNEEYKYALILSAFSLIISLLIGFICEYSKDEMVLRSGGILLSSFISPLVALSILPIFERFVGGCTNFTLLEYSNT
ncbi:MAG: hypothetical protein ACPL6C_02030, partial [bacterium]